ncbi:TfoX/Sxy family protein [Variovorax sp. PCZ-1]|nr:TfoX/Sxy family protein [Variovorax sp. PCZ-1]
MPAKTPSAIPRQFADYCCDLLSTQGACLPKRMFGGWSISIEGMTLAIIANVGSGEKLWLKGDDVVRARFEAAGCERFTYQMKDRLASMGYYTAPEEAMDSQDAMRPWARLALECAVRARAAKPIPKPRAKPATKAVAKPTKPRAAKSAAPRKSRKA